MYDGSPQEHSTTYHFTRLGVMSKAPLRQCLTKPCRPRAHPSRPDIWAPTLCSKVSKICVKQAILVAMQKAPDNSEPLSATDEVGY